MGEAKRRRVAVQQQVAVQFGIRRVTGTLPMFPPEWTRDYPEGVKYPERWEWYYLEGHVSSCSWMGPAVFGTVFVMKGAPPIFGSLMVTDIFRRHGFATRAILEAACRWPGIYWEAIPDALPFSEALVARGIARKLSERLYCALPVNKSIEDRYGSMRSDNALVCHTRAMVNGAAA